MANLRRDVFEAIGLAGTPTRSYPPLIAQELKKKALVDRSGVQERIASITGDLSTAAFVAAVLDILVDNFRTRDGMDKIMSDS